MSSIISKQDIVPIIIQIIGYACIIYLAWTYITHGLGALSVTPGFVALITGLGIPFALAKILVVIVGVVDILVAIALFAYRRKWVLAYAGIWPLVPFVLGYLTSNSWTLGYLMYPALAAIAFICFFTFTKVKDDEITMHEELTK